MYGRASEGAIVHDGLWIRAGNQTVPYKDGLLGAEIVLEVPEGKNYVNGTQVYVNFFINLVISPCGRLAYTANLYRIEE